MSETPQNDEIVQNLGLALSTDQSDAKIKEVRAIESEEERETALKPSDVQESNEAKE